jgi:hypothetical protein
MTIVDFPFQQRIEISASTVTSETITDANGSRPDFTNVGSRCFFVEALLADGSTELLFYGPSHAEAFQLARDAAKYYGPVRDLTNGGVHG